jgi:hypothetical protein
MENNTNNNNVAPMSMSIIDGVTLDNIQRTLSKINGFHTIVKSTLIQGTDYGIIQGTTKPVLFKSGAETILMLFGIASSIEIVSAVPEVLGKDTEFVSYTIKCRLMRDGIIVSEGIGTCNTCEKKYKHEDALNIANTIMKMASKRALLDSVLRVASLSAVFEMESGDMADYLSREQLENLGVEDASNLKITFGKHKNKTCGDVYKNHFDYVKWFADNGRDERVQKAFQVLSEAARIHAENASAKKTEAKQNNEGGNKDDGEPNTDVHMGDGSGGGDS